MFLLLARSFLTKRQGEDAKGKVLEGHVVLWSVFVCVFCFVSFLVSLKGGGGDGEARPACTGRGPPQTVRQRPDIVVDAAAYGS